MHHRTSDLSFAACFEEFQFMLKDQFDVAPKYTSVRIVMTKDFKMMAGDLERAKTISSEEFSVGFEALRKLHSWIHFFPCGISQSTLVIGVDLGPKKTNLEPAAVNFAGFPNSSDGKPWFDKVNLI